MKAKIKPGYRINHITVLEDTGRRNEKNRKIWLCQCDCGKIFEKGANRLNGKGANKSCGCEYSFDLTGKKFGSLTVVSQLSEKYHGKKMWLCKCDCGNEIKIPLKSLKSKDPKFLSCGCLLSHDKEQIHLPVGIDGIYYGNSNPYTLKFEDGYSIKTKYRRDGAKISHPVLRLGNKGFPFDYLDFKVTKVAFKMNDVVYYHVIRPDGDSDCMTPKEMLNYKQKQINII